MTVDKVEVLRHLGKVKDFHMDTERVSTNFTKVSRVEEDSDSDKFCPPAQDFQAHLRRMSKIQIINVT